MSDSKHVLFVCTGNTCRSPMAEALFRLACAGRNDVTVSSAGIAAAKGQPASREAQQIVAHRGGSLAHFKSRPVTEPLLQSASHVFVMTEGHLAALEARFPQHADKFYLLREFASVPGKRQPTDVPDPIGMGLAAYQDVATILDAAIPAILAYVTAPSRPK